MKIAEFLALPVEQLKSIKNIMFDGYSPWVVSLEAQKFEGVALINFTERDELAHCDKFNMVAFKEVCRKLGQCSSLQKLKFHDINFSEEVISTLGGVLSACQTIKEIEVIHCAISGYYHAFNMDHFKSLISVICGPSLEKLSIINDGLGSLDISKSQIQVLVDGLSRCPLLKTLNLSYNVIGKLDESSIQVLVAGLSRCLSLKTLDLSRNCIDKLDESSIQILVAGLSRCPSLRILNVAYNDLRPEQIQRFEAMIVEHKAAMAADRAQTRAFLTSWRHLWVQHRGEHAAAVEEPIDLGDMPEDIVYKILAATGAITDIRIKSRPSVEDGTAAAAKASSAAMVDAGTSSTPSREAATAPIEMPTTYTASYKRQPLQIQF